MGFTGLRRDAEIGKWAGEWKGKGMKTSTTLHSFATHSLATHSIAHPCDASTCHMTENGIC